MACDSIVCLVQWIVFVPTLIAGLPLNLAALWLLLFRVRRRSESTVYLLSLVLNDCLLLFSLPFKMHAYNREWKLGRGFCSMLESLVYVNIYGSILLTVCISVDRYVSLCSPFTARRLRSPRKAWIVCFAIWSIICVASFPVYSFHSANSTDKYCFQNFSNDTWNQVGLVVSMQVVFCSSALVMVFCTLQVVRILHRLRRRNPEDEKLRNNKSIKIVMSNLFVFLACFIPYHVAVLIYFVAKNVGGSEIHPLREFVHISSCVSSINCLADGACYYFILKENLQSALRERRAVICIRDTRTKPPQTVTQSTLLDVHDNTQTGKQTDISENHTDACERQTESISHTDKL
ncbi:G-protein coupled receptor 55a [Chanos chanos]|uniref:G-protein coupled receptor 55a n=1 Tax=Chanos chanos TaxID=29144 RepID=A0A6J2VLI2_CHACN|nr:lysophosphatidic acid receptor 6-like [Chanos chanos]